MATSVKLLLKNKPRSDFTYPIVLQVIKDGKAKVISTGISCNKSDWTGQELKKTHPNFQKRNLILMNIKQEKPANATETFKFFTWAYKSGDKIAADLDYVPMPDATTDFIRKSVWSQINTK